MVEIEFIKISKERSNSIKNNLLNYIQMARDIRKSNKNKYEILISNNIDKGYYKPRIIGLKNNKIKQMKIKTYTDIIFEEKINKFDEITEIKIDNKYNSINFRIENVLWNIMLEDDLISLIAPKHQIKSIDNKILKNYTISEIKKNINILED